PSPDIPTAPAHEDPSPHAPPPNPDIDLATSSDRAEDSGPVDAALPQPTAAPEADAIDDERGPAGDAELDDGEYAEYARSVEQAAARNRARLQGPTVPAASQGTAADTL